MFLDSTLTFNSAVGTAQTVTATASSSGIIDVTGAGSGTAPAMINGFPATNTAIGNDYGAGDGEAIPHVVLVVPAAGSGSGTVQIAVQAAPDNGSYGQGSYTTLVQTPALTGSTLVAGTVIDIPLPPARVAGIGEALPRFYKLVYTVASTASVKFLSNLILNPAQVAQLQQYNSNYIVV